MKYLAILMCLLLAPMGMAAPRSTESLERELTRIAAGVPAVVGVAVHHLESGRGVTLNGRIPFPMASTLKVPVAVHVLALVDEGKLRIDQLVTLQPGDVYPLTHGPISDFLSPGTALTIRDLIALMLMNSDNNATDVLLRVSGGPAAVTARSRSFGLKDMRNDRPIWVLDAHIHERFDVSIDNPLTREEYREMLTRPYTEEQLLRFYGNHERNIQDTSTPADMGSLLTQLWNGKILSKASTQLLLDIMYGCITGEGRLKGMLPPGTKVAHKTGTTGETITNDVGIIDLPDGAGHVVTVVYTKQSKEILLEKREAAIAQIARAAHDFFVFNRP